MKQMTPTQKSAPHRYRLPVGPDAVRDIQAKANHLGPDKSEYRAALLLLASCIDLARTIGCRDEQVINDLRDKTADYRNGHKRVDSWLFKFLGECVSAFGDDIETVLKIRDEIEARRIKEEAERAMKKAEQDEEHRKYMRKRAALLNADVASFDRLVAEAAKDVNGEALAKLEARIKELEAQARGDTSA